MHKFWDIDLPDGQFSEEIVKDMLTRRQGIEGRTRFEVKTDWVMSKSGNLFFEYRCRGKKSGLSVTRADWWVICVPNHGLSTMLFCEVRVLKSVLKKLLAEGKAWKKMGGDDNLSEGLLVKAQDFLQAVIE